MSDIKSFHIGITPGVYNLPNDEDINSIEQWATEQEYEYFLVDRITDGKSFIDKSAEVLKFPDYYRPNWNSFEEIISDPSVLKGKGYLIIYKNLDSFRANSEQSWNTIIDIFTNAAKYWQENGVTFYVLFKYSESSN